MKQILIPIIIVTFIGCKESNSTKHDHANANKVDNDTIFISSKPSATRWKNFRFVIKLRDTVDNPIKFKLNQPNYLKLTVEPLNQYPIILDDLVNVEIDTINSNLGIYKIVPNDSSFRIGIFQDYGKGNVILAYQDEQGNITYNQYDDVRQIGVLKETVE